MRIIAEIEKQKHLHTSMTGYEPNVVLIGVDLKHEFFLEVSKFSHEQIMGSLSGTVFGLIIVPNQVMPKTIAVCYCKEIK